MRTTATIAVLLLAVAFLRPDGPKVQAQTAKINEVKASVQPAKPKVSKQTIVTVNQGDTLTKIAKKHKTTYQRIYSANEKVKNPDLIYVGDKLRIPNKDEKLKNRPLPEAVIAKPVKKVVKQSAVSNTPVKQQSSAAVYAPGNTVWDRLAACESGGNWAINTGNGYYGGIQFSLATWRGLGAPGYPHQSSKATQIYYGKMLQARSGWGQWPACSAKLGLL